jgi:uncharacterized protein YcaQ
MNKSLLTISREAQRRFILGQQGLWPGRRYQGRQGVLQAVTAGAVVQVDPLNVVAHSHDIALYGRVVGYRPEHLTTLLYQERQLFDWGGTVMIQPMAELPYWRVVMERKRQEPRWVAFAAEHGPTIEAVRAAIAARGPLGARDFGGETRQAGSFRSKKVAGQALYYLWLIGELMSHGRRGTERLYDLRQRVAPPGLDYSAKAEEADDYFASRVLQAVGMTTEAGWRRWLAGTIERPVSRQEARARLDQLLAEGRLAAVTLADDPKEARYVAADQLDHLSEINAGRAPDSWRPLAATTDDEVVLLAPLEIVSARGRAKLLFGFDYLWEVYKPAEKRRWGYYTLPILHRDELVARLDARLERATATLVIQGFWLESGVVADVSLLVALAAGLARFRELVGATSMTMAATAVGAETLTAVL